jgi:O-antigen ligase
VLIAGVFVASSLNIERIQQSAHDSNIAFLREGIGRSDSSAASRGALWRPSVDLYQSGGLLGQGPVSTKTRLQDELAPLVKEAHDDYLAAITERGILGAVGLFVLLGALLSRAGGLSTSALREGYAAVIRRPNALLGAMAGTMVAMLVYELLHLRHLWAFFGILAAVSIWGRR